MVFAWPKAGMWGNELECNSWVWDKNHSSLFWPQMWAVYFSRPTLRCNIFTDNSFCLPHACILQEESTTLVAAVFTIAFLRWMCSDRWPTFIAFGSDRGCPPLPLVPWWQGAQAHLLMMWFQTEWALFSWWWGSLFNQSSGTKLTVVVILDTNLKPGPHWLLSWLRSKWLQYMNVGLIRKAKNGDKREICHPSTVFASIDIKTIRNRWDHTQFRARFNLVEDSLLDDILGWCLHNIPIQPLLFGKNPCLQVMQIGAKSGSCFWRVDRAFSSISTAVTTCSGTLSLFTSGVGSGYPGYPHLHSYTQNNARFSGWAPEWSCTSSPT